jgi:Sulfotransferase family
MNEDVRFEGLSPRIDEGSAHAAEEHERLVQARLAHLTPVNQPVAMISQMPRSGGTLLMRLFDGHPQCHSIPHELGRSFRNTKKLGCHADRAWGALRDEKLDRLFRDGYRQARRKLNGDLSTYPLLLPPQLHRRLFDEIHARLVTEKQVTSRRVMDAYLTSYFNAWLDNRNLRGEKRWVTAFAPGVIGDPSSIRRFFELYPDGVLLSVIRDPVTWFASAQRWSPRWASRETAAAAWVATAEATLELADEIGDRLVVIQFESLIEHCEETMRALSDRLAIDFDPVLLTPTFNGWPIGANSSFVTVEEGLSLDPVRRRAELVGAADREFIQSQTHDLQRRLLEHG